MIWNHNTDLNCVPVTSQRHQNGGGTATLGTFNMNQNIKREIAYCVQAPSSPALVTAAARCRP